MNTLHNVGKQVSSFEQYDQLDPITGIALVVDNEDAYFAGDETGTVLDVYCPYGTQEMANTLLSQLRGQVYAGFRAQNAILSPAAELGDWVTVNGGTYMLAYRSVTFGPGHMAEIAAPGESTQEHEYGWTSPENKKFDYELNKTRSLISKSNKEIQLAIYGEDGKGGLSGDLTTLSLALGSISAEIRNYEKTVGGYIDEVASYKLEADGFRADLERNTETIEGFTKENARFKATLDEFSGTMQSHTDTVNGYESRITEFSATLEGFENRIQTSEKTVDSYKEALGTYSQAADNFSAKVETYEQTVSGYTRQVASFEGKIDGFNQRVETYSNDVKSYEAAYSQISQKVDKIKLEVVNDNGEVSITLNAGGTSLGSGSIDMSGLVTFTSLKNAPEEGQTKINGGWIETGTLVVGSISNFDTAVGNKITSTVNETYIAGKGALTKTALSTAPKATDATIIHGGWIQTNTIDASCLKADTVVAGSIMGETVHLYSVAEETAEGIELYDAGEIAITGAETTEFSVDLISNGSLRLATNLYEDEDEDEMFAGPIFLGVGRYWGGKNYKYFAHLSIEEVDELGFQICAGTNIIPSKRGFDLGHDYYPWNNIYSIQNYAETGEAGTSDRNKKNSISYDLSRYDAFFDRLQPTIYKLNNGTSGRFHVGMIAQDVEKALAESGIPTSDFGGYIKTKDSYALRYSEFIGLLIDQVQKLKARVAELEEKL